MTGYDVDPDALRGASPKFASTADAIKAAFDTLNGVLQAEGNCWGGDESGQKFGSEYEPARDSAVTAFGELGGAVGEIRTKLDAAAASWESDDQANSDRFR